MFVSRKCGKLSVLNFKDMAFLNKDCQFCYSHNIVKDYYENGKLYAVCCIEINM